MARRRKKDLITAECGVPTAGVRSFFAVQTVFIERTENHTMLYVCSGYPKCDSYVRVHRGTGIPVGTMANKNLRALRRKAHSHFDQLHRSGFMSREDAYLWLAAQIGAPLSEAHIGHLGEYYCDVVIKESSKLLANHGIRSNVS